MVGNPVAHSRSPRIHALFAEQTGEQLRYDALFAPLDGFSKIVGEFLSRGGCGLNVTLPFKEEAFALVSSHSDHAQRARAVNTISKDRAGLLRGHNTDGSGLVRDLQVNLSVRLRQARVLILGAGGAVRGIIMPLLAAGVATVEVLNRTSTRAELLVQDLNEPRLHMCDGPPPSPFDLVINGSAAGHDGLAPQMPSGCIGLTTTCYDLSYGAAALPFTEAARSLGAGIIADGLGMLVEQAAEAFFIWRGVRPRTASVIRQLREDVG